MIVAKIGGKLVSSLALPEIAACLFGRFGRPLALLAGGGAAADLVRTWDDSLHLDSDDAHWLAIRAMSLQADLLARRLKLPTFDDLSIPMAHRVAVMDLHREASTHPTTLPISWHVTSDSLAAWAAKRLGADHLVMVKSVGDEATSIDLAASRGWVDPYFVAAAEGLFVDWLNAATLASGLSQGSIDRPVP